MDCACVSVCVFFCVSERYFFSESFYVKTAKDKQGQERCGLEEEEEEEEGEKERSTKGYRHCGFSATEKNLIVIYSGWHFGIWLVGGAYFSSVLTYKFWDRTVAQKSLF